MGKSKTVTVTAEGWFLFCPCWLEEGWEHEEALAPIPKLGMWWLLDAALLPLAEPKQIRFEIEEEDCFMSTSDTPRTDAEIKIWHGEVAVIYPDFARQLERELKMACEIAVGAQKAEKEWRELAGEEEALKEKALREIDELKADMLELEEERNEANKQLQHWKANAADQKRKKQAVSKKLSDIIRRLKIATDALKEINGIQLQYNGGDWCEIEQAKEIATDTLKQIGEQ